MRYISAPQRSHFIASSPFFGDAVPSAETTGVMMGGGGSLRAGESTPAL
jgi:hypothetical protein